MKSPDFRISNHFSNIICLSASEKDKLKKACGLPGAYGAARGSRRLFPAAFRQTGNDGSARLQACGTCFFFFLLAVILLAAFAAAADWAAA